ncbi:xylose reductase [Dichotomocladium elegans]|nr:xylose reductase [Dichotomocladium elegans]
MPLVGLGTWKIADDHSEEIIYQAIKAGYRLIDTASVYKNEGGVGRGIRKAISEGIVTRKDIFLVTKLWNTFHAKQHVRAACERQLKDLGVDYIDLYHVHWPLPQKYVDPSHHYPTAWMHPESNEFEMERAPLHELWPEMEKLVEAGLVRNLGVSNFNVMLMVDLLTYAKIPPSVLQIELHPYLQQTRLIQWMQKKGIQVTAYSSFGPAAFDTIVPEAKDLVPLLEHDTITRIARKHDKTTAQVALRWSIERNVAVIPKSANLDRMKSNLELYSWSLDEQDREDIAALDRNVRYNRFDVYGIDLPLFE